MVLVKLLGGIDIAAAFALLLMVFGVDVLTQYVLFCAGLLMIKGLFALTGDVLSFVDLGASMVLILSIFFSLPYFLLWIFTFLLLAKGAVSFF